MSQVIWLQAKRKQLKSSMHGAENLNQSCNIVYYSHCSENQIGVG